jgi:hypothetical protein
MRTRGFLQFGIVWGVALGAAAQAADRVPNTASAAKATPYARVQPNASYLGNLQKGVAAAPQVSNEELLDQRSSVELKQQYQDMVRQYEQREAYGQASLQEKKDHVERVRGFSRGVMAQVQRNQIQGRLERAKTAAESNPTLSKVRKPVELLAAGVALYYGTPVRLRLGNGSSVMARAHVPNQQGALALSSPLLNTSVDFNFAPLSAEEQRRQQALDRTQRLERVRVGVSRGLPVWGLHSGVSYGKTTGTLTASLSKQLNENLSAVVDSSRALESSTASEESLKLLYGIRF